MQPKIHETGHLKSNPLDSPIQEQKKDPVVTPSPPVETKKQTFTPRKQRYIPFRLLEGRDVKNDYIHADEKGIYVFVPTIQGKGVGGSVWERLSALYSLWGYPGGQSPITITQSITKYIRDLQSDLTGFKLLDKESRKPYALLIRQKERRLKHLQYYQNLFNELENHPEVQFDQKQLHPDIQNKLGHSNETKENKSTSTQSPQNEKAVSTSWRVKLKTMLEKEKKALAERKCSNNKDLASPFSSKEGEPESFFIRCQLFIAFLNAYCYEQKHSYVDFNRVFENPQLGLGDRLIAAIESAIKKNESIEEAIWWVVYASQGHYYWQNSGPFNLKQTLIYSDERDIKERFKTLWNNVKGHVLDGCSAIIPEETGSFYNLGDNVAMSLADFMNIPHSYQDTTSAETVKKLRSQYFEANLSTSPLLPPIPNFCEVEKRDLNPNLTFEINLSSLLQQKEDPSDFLAQVLTDCMPGTGKKMLFDETVITQEDKREIITSPWWPQIKAKVLETLEEGEIENFLQQFSSLKMEMERKDQTHSLENPLQFTPETAGSEAFVGLPPSIRIKQSSPVSQGVNQASEEKKEKKNNEKSEYTLDISDLRMTNLFLEAEASDCLDGVIRRTLPGCRRMEVLLSFLGCKGEITVTRLGTGSNFSYRITSENSENIDYVKALFERHVCAIKLTLAECKTICGDENLKISDAPHELALRFDAKELDIPHDYMEIVSPSQSGDSKETEEPYIRIVVANDKKSEIRKRGLSAIALMLTTPEFNFSESRTQAWFSLENDEQKKVDLFLEKHKTPLPAHIIQVPASSVKKPGTTVAINQQKAPHNKDNKKDNKNAPVNKGQVVNNQPKNNQDNKTATLNKDTTNNAVGNQRVQTPPQNPTPGTGIGKTIGNILTPSRPSPVSRTSVPDSNGNDKKVAVVNRQEIKTSGDIKKAQETKERSKNEFHIPRLMVKSLYLELNNRGIPVPSAKSGSERIKAVLSLLGCQGDIQIRERADSNGYGIAAADPKHIEIIKGIYDRYLNSDQVRAINLSLAECNKICGGRDLDISQARFDLADRFSINKLDVLYDAIEIVSPKSNTDAKPYIRVIVADDRKSSGKKQGCTAIALMLATERFDFSKCRTQTWENLQGNEEKVTNFLTSHTATHTQGSEPAVSTSVSARPIQGRASAALDTKAPNSLRKNRYIPIRLFEREDVNYDNIHADEKGVYVFVPVVQGEWVGTDETCKGFLALQDFWGLKDDDKSRAPSGASEVTSYIHDLQVDLAIFSLIDEKSKTPYQALIQQKTERLRQLKAYQSLFNELKNDHGVKKTPTEFPHCIQNRLGNLNEAKGNCVSILLSPASEINGNKVEPSKTLFSVSRSGVHGAASATGLGAELRKMLGEEKKTLAERKGLRDILAEETADRYRQKQQEKKVASDNVRNDSDLEVLKDCLRETCLKHNLFPAPTSTELKEKSVPQGLEFKHPLKQSGGFTTSNGLDTSTSLNWDSVSNLCLMGTDIDLLTGTKQFIQTAIANERFIVSEQRFNPFIGGDPESFSIRCQLFLAIANAYCYEQGYSSANFGQVVEEKSNNLLTPLMTSIREAIQKGSSIEDAILNVINPEPFKLSQPLMDKDRENIKERFKCTWHSIKSHQHFDQFLLMLPGKKGPFYNMRANVAMPLAEFMSTPNGNTQSDETVSRLKSQYFEAKHSSTGLLLPPIPPFENQRVVKRDLNPKNLTFEINLSLLLEEKEDPSDFLAKVLTDHGEGTRVRRLFDKNIITLEDKQEIMKSKWWPQIKDKVLGRLKENERTAFYEWAGLKEQAENPPQLQSTARTTNSKIFVGMPNSIRIKESSQPPLDVKRESKEKKDNKGEEKREDEREKKEKDIQKLMPEPQQKIQEEAKITQHIPVPGEEAVENRPEREAPKTSTLPGTGNSNLSPGTPGEPLEAHKETKELNIDLDKSSNGRTQALGSTEPLNNTEPLGKNISPDSNISPSTPAEPLKDNETKKLNSIDPDKSSNGRTQALGSTEPLNNTGPLKTGTINITPDNSNLGLGTLVDPLIENKKEEIKKSDADSNSLLNNSPQPLLNPMEPSSSSSIAQTDLDKKNESDGTPTLLDQSREAKIFAASRVLMFGAIAAITFYNFIDFALSYHSGTELMWGCYLTQWNLAFIFIHQLIEVSRVIQAWIKSDKNSFTANMLSVKDQDAHAKSRTVGLNVSLMVTGLFWTMVYNPTEFGPWYVNVLAQGLPALLYLLDIVGNQLKTPHSGTGKDFGTQVILPSAAFAISYLIFSVVYQYASGRNPEGDLISAVLNWHQPETAIPAIAGVIGLLLVTGLTHLLTKHLIGENPATPPKHRLGPVNPGVFQSSDNKESNPEKNAIPSGASGNSPSFGSKEDSA